MVFFDLYCYSLRSLLMVLFLSMCLFGIYSSVFACYRFYDLKKVIAFSTLVHVNISVLSFACFSSVSLVSVLVLSLSHSFTSCGLFLVISVCLSSSYSRTIESLSFASYKYRVLFILFLCNFSCPTSINLVGQI